MGRQFCRAKKEGLRHAAEAFFLLREAAFQPLPKGRVRSAAKFFQRAGEWSSGLPAPGPLESCVLFSGSTPS
jgi:hypothetical protein